MPFSIQYSTATGEITGTVNSVPPTDMLPEGIGQITFDDWQEWNGKKVDLATLTLVDAPPPQEE